MVFGWPEWLTWFSPILPDDLVCLTIENIRVTGRMTGCLVNQGTEKKNTEWKLQAMSWTA